MWTPKFGAFLMEKVPNLGVHNFKSQIWDLYCKHCLWSIFGPCLCTKSCKTTFYAHLSRIWKLTRFTRFIRKVFATNILLSGKFSLFVTLISHWWATVDNTLEIILKWKAEQWKKNIFLVTSSVLMRQSHDFFAANYRMSRWLRVMSATFKQQLKSLMGNCTQHWEIIFQYSENIFLVRCRAAACWQEIQVNTFAANFRMSLWLRVMSAMPATMRTAIMNWHWWQDGDNILW